MWRVLKCWCRQICLRKMYQSFCRRGNGVYGRTCVRPIRKCPGSARSANIYSCHTTSSSLRPHMIHPGVRVCASYPHFWHKRSHILELPRLDYGNPIPAHIYPSQHHSYHAPMPVQPQRCLLRRNRRSIERSKLPNSCSISLQRVDPSQGNISATGRTRHTRNRSPTILIRSTTRRC